MPRKRDLPPEGPRLVGYARVSTVEQNLDMQISALKAAGVFEDNIWTEKISGVARNRPQLRLALMDARPGDTFVVWKLDRLGRSLLDLLGHMNDLEKRQVAFRSLTEGIDTRTPTGKLLLHVIGALAQFERDLIVERTRAGIAEHRARGGRMGQPPKMTPPKIKEAMKMIEGGTSVIDVAHYFHVAPGTIYNHLAGTISELRDRQRRKRKPSK